MALRRLKLPALSDQKSAQSFQVFKMGEAPRGWDSPSAILEINHEPTEKCIFEMDRTGIWHSIISGSPDRDDQFRIAQAMIKEPESVILEPAKTVFGSESFESRTWTFNSSRDKSLVFSEFEGYLRWKGASSGVIHAMIHVADELFTNSIFNAPFAKRSTSPKRSEVVVLDPTAANTIVIALNKDRAFIGCTDHFGSLKCDLLLKQIAKCFRNGALASMNRTNGGAGLGFLQILNFCQDIYIISQEGTRTFVGCTFLCGREPRLRRGEQKNIHLQQFGHVQQDDTSVILARRNKKAFLTFRGGISRNQSLSRLESDSIEAVFLNFKDLDVLALDAFENTMQAVEEHFSKADLFISPVSSQLLWWSHKIKHSLRNRVTLTVECLKCQTKHKEQLDQIEKKSTATECDDQFLTCPTCENYLAYKY